MGGPPESALRINLRECGLSRDPVGMEWRVKEYDLNVTKFRKEEVKRRQNKNNRAGRW